MTAINANDIENFRSRFCSFYDGVIRSISMLYRTANNPTEVEVVVSVRDIKGVDDDGWVNVHLRLTNVTEFTIHESDTDSYQVLSNGIHIQQFGELFSLEFGSYSDNPKDLGEIRNSKFYFVGSQIEWEVSRYQEQLDQI